MRSSSAPASPASSPPMNWSRPGAACWCSIRRTAPTSAARRSGRWAACSSSTVPSSGGSGSRIRSRSPARIGWVRRSSTALEDYWPRRWAEAYVEFAATEKRGYLRDLGLRVLPLVGWAERGDGRARGHGNSVPRFHLTWGTGPEVVRVFLEPVLEAERQGLVSFAFRHQVDELIVSDGAVIGVRGSVLEPTELERGLQILAQAGRGIRAARRRGARLQRRDRA